MLIDHLGWFAVGIVFGIKLTLVFLYVMWFVTLRKRARARRFPGTMTFRMRMASGEGRVFWPWSYGNFIAWRERDSTGRQWNVMMAVQDRHGERYVVHEVPHTEAYGVADAIIRAAEQVDQEERDAPRRA